MLNPVIYCKFYNFLAHIFFFKRIFESFLAHELPSPAYNSIDWDKSSNALLILPIPFYALFRKLINAYAWKDEVQLPNHTTTPTYSLQ